MRPTRIFFTAVAEARDSDICVAFIGERPGLSLRQPLYCKVTRSRIGARIRLLWTRVSIVWMDSRSDNSNGGTRWIDWDRSTHSFTPPKAGVLLLQDAISGFRRRVLAR